MIREPLFIPFMALLVLMGCGRAQTGDGGGEVAALQTVTISSDAPAPERSRPSCLDALPAPVHIKGGTFRMGSDDAYPEEGPSREVTVDAFWIDATEVTTAQFAQFIDATGYLTVAERAVDASLYPGADPEFLKPGAAVFKVPLTGTPDNFLDWWAYVPGAHWRLPTGTVGGAPLPRHPVTQIAFEDAIAYATWRGGRLPTEAEWEYAALGGATESLPATIPPQNANTWQGIFPVLNTEEDGFKGIAAVGCFDANAYGLFDMLGNVWEWTADWYAPRHVDDTAVNPTGAGEDLAHDPHNPGLPPRVVKGGSFLCAENYCIRYRPSARHAQDTGLGTNHIGFRVAYDASQSDR